MYTDNKNEIYLGNLDYGVNEDDIKASMSEKGLQVNDVKVVKDKITGRSKGFGFCSVGTKEAVNEVVEKMDGVEIKGRKIRVSPAKPKSEKRPFQRGGGSFRSQY